MEIRDKKPALWHLREIDDHCDSLGRLIQGGVVIDQHDLGKIRKMESELEAMAENYRNRRAENGHRRY